MRKSREFGAVERETREIGEGGGGKRSFEAPARAGKGKPGNYISSEFETWAARP